jgi:hypothetical protein
MVCKSEVREETGERGREREGEGCHLSVAERRIKGEQLGEQINGFLASFAEIFSVEMRRGRGAEEQRPHRAQGSNETLRVGSWTVRHLSTSLVPRLTTATFTK